MDHDPSAMLATTIYRPPSSPAPPQSRPSQDLLPNALQRSQKKFFFIKIREKSFNRFVTPKKRCPQKIPMPRFPLIFISCCRSAKQHHHLYFTVEIIITRSRMPFLIRQKKLQIPSMLFDSFPFFPLFFLLAAFLCRR